MGIIAMCVLVGVVIVWLGERRQPLPALPGKVQVVASFYPLAFFAERIGGEKAEVVNITPAGAEPHDYEPTVSDMARIEKSQLLVLNGGGLEAWGKDVLKNIDPTRTRAVIAGDGLITRRVNEDGQAIIDPHVWLSPPLAEKIVDQIAQAFIRIDVQNGAYYRTNADALKSELHSLDKQYEDGLKNCMSSNIVTSHAAFGYLALEYHVHQVAIAGLSPDAEPSPRQLGDIADFVRKNKVGYIFFEDLVSPKLSETMATETGAHTMVLNPIEGLSNDELASGRNYFTEMESNLNNLQTALQCQK